MGRRKQSERVDDALECRIKVHVAGDAIGPGKIELLRNIERCGSISGAARELGISYRRAWHLLDTVGAILGARAVDTEVGGSQGGAARLTPVGAELVRRYDALLREIDRPAADIVGWIAAQRGATYKTDE